jgi:ferrochelatase
MIDSLLVLGFGGPEPGCCRRRASCSQAPGCEAECFVSGILGDDATKAGRVAEVVEHYRHLGGYSPYNQLARRQVEAVRRELARRACSIPIALAFRHWSPWVGEAVRELKNQGGRNPGLLILSVHQSRVGWDDYVALAEDACAQAGGLRLGNILPPFFDHPAYATAIAAQVAAATAAWPVERAAAAALIFTAHAIPVPAEATSPYRRQIDLTVTLATRACARQTSQLAFQSQPAQSRISWSRPSVDEALAQAKAAGHHDVILQPCGFLVDHVEVLYDLDIAAQAEARRLGLGLVRAACVHDHPAFIGLLADRVQDALRS